MKRAALRVARAISTRFRFRGQTRLLRFLHTPDRDGRWAFETIVPYDKGRIHVNTGSWIEWNIFFFGAYESDLVALIDRLVPAGAVCLDIGANIGCHTLPMAWRAGPTGRVIAFEPNVDVRRQLERNVSLNRLLNVDIKDVAVSDRSGEATLFREEKADFNKGKASLAPRTKAGVTTRGQEIRTAAVADIAELQVLARLDFIKIDTEGHDGIVLGQLKPLLARFHPVVVFEYDPEAWPCHSGAPVSKVLSDLRALGYSIRELSSERLAGGAYSAIAPQNLVCTPTTHVAQT